MGKRNTRKAALDLIAASKMERAKALKAVKSIAPGAAIDLQKLFVSDGSVEEQELERSIAGLKEEDEFAVMCRILGTCRLLVDLGQRPLVASEVIVPDFLAEFQTGNHSLNIPDSQSRPMRCLIEVKSTESDVLTFKGSLLRRRREFARKLGLPLLIAVRFTRITGNAVWAVVWDEDQSKSRIDVTVQDMADGVARLIWNDFVLMPRPDLQFVRSYDSSYPREGGIWGEGLGRFVGLRLVTNDHDITLSETHAHIHTAVADAIGLKEISRVTQGSKTEVILQSNGMATFFSNLMYRLNHVLTDDEGATLFDSSKITAHADTEEFSWLIGREIGQQACEELVSMGVAHVASLGKEPSLRRQWEGLFCA